MTIVTKPLSCTFLMYSCRTLACSHASSPLRCGGGGRGVGVSFSRLIRTVFSQFKVKSLQHPSRYVFSIIEIDVPSFRSVRSF